MKRISILILVTAIAPLYGFYPGPLAKKKAALQEQVKTALAQKQVDRAQDLINQIQKETRDPALVATLQQELVAVKTQVEQARKTEPERRLVPATEQERRLAPVGEQTDTQKRAEEARKAAEDRRKLEEARQKAEQLRKAEEAKKAEDARLAEEARKKAEQARKQAEDERLARERAEEEKRAAAARAALHGNDRNKREALKKIYEQQYQSEYNEAGASQPTFADMSYKNLGVQKDAIPEEILGLKVGATADEENKIYKVLYLKWHPDKHPGDKNAEDTFKLIHWAHEQFRKRITGQ